MMNATQEDSRVRELGTQSAYAKEGCVGREGAELLQ